MADMSKEVLLSKLKEIKGACDALAGRIKATLQFYEKLEKRVVIDMRANKIPEPQVQSFVKEITKYKDQVKGWMRDLEEGK